MQQTWRWFGPQDKVSLSDVRQAGATGIVTALHHLPAGDVWTETEIAQRQGEISEGSDGALEWRVVESLPVSEAIKTKGPAFLEHVANYIASMEALARAGLEVICYNFMPVLDWTRTELRAPMKHGGTAMRFDLTKFAAFDLFILKRAGAEGDYPDTVREAAHARFAAMPEAERESLAQTVGAGLPGAVDRWTLAALRDALAAYDTIDTEKLRANHVDFLSEIAPVAERLGLRMCCHPDDPPFDLLGLPRTMSTADDYAWVMDAVPSPAVGMTLCTGSLGVRSDNDCAQMMRDFGPRVHFLHLRNVTREADARPCSFFEDEHLAGQVDMVAVLQALADEEARRRSEGRADAEIPMRADHGQEILSDIGAHSQPGYPAVGRLKGLAELRGAMMGLGGTVT